MLNIRSHLMDLKVGENGYLHYIRQREESKNCIFFHEVLFLESASVVNTPTCVSLHESLQIPQFDLVVRQLHQLHS